MGALPLPRTQTARRVPFLSQCLLPFTPSSPPSPTSSTALPRPPARPHWQHLAFSSTLCSPGLTRDLDTAKKEQHNLNSMASPKPWFPDLHRGNAFGHRDYVIHKWHHALEAPSSVPGTLGAKHIVNDIIILL